MNLREPLKNIQGVVMWYWRRLGESAALSPVVAWSYFPLGLLGPVFLDSYRLGGSIGSWLVVGLVGQLVVLVSLWISRRVIHRKTAFQSRPLANFAAILIATGLRGVSLAWAAQVLMLTDNFDVAYRIGAGFFTQTGLLVTVAIIVSSFRYHRQLVAKLWSQQEQLRELSSSMQDRLADTRSALAAQVRLTINPLIEKIKMGLERVANGEDSEDICELIREIVDERLRPLSHNLESQPSSEIELPTISSTPLNTWIPLPSQRPLSILMRPIATSFIVALLAASPGLLAIGIVGAVVYPLVAFVLAVPVLLVLRALIGSWKLPLGLGISVVFLVSAVGVASTKISIAERILPFPDTNFLVTFMGGGLAGLFAAALALANERRLSIERELRSSIEELQMQLSFLRQHESVTRKELSYVLHGSVQSALHVAAMRLASTVKPDVSLLSSIRTAIETATDRLETPALSDVLIIDTLADIAELWDGTCSVKWTLDHQTVRRLVDSPVAASCVAEITRECVGNAIRHGRATEVWITITTSLDRVTLMSLDNGTVKTDWTPGMGSRMMNEMCLSWSYSVGLKGVRVTAEIAASSL